MKNKIISDSSSNLLQLEEIQYQSVPLKIRAGEREYIDDEYLDVNQMVEELSRHSGTSGTSCPNVHEWYEAFKEAQVSFGITITSSLSGSYSAVFLAKEQLEKEFPQKKVILFDSLSTGPEMKLIIEKIAKLLKEQRAPEEVEKIVSSYQKHTHLIFSLASLENLAKNGRVHWAIAKVAGVLGIRVIGKANEKGVLQLLHKSRGEKKTLETIIKEMKRWGFSGQKVRIDHVLYEKGAKELQEMILKEFPNSDIQVAPCRGLCSYYAERGGLMVGFEGKEEA